MSDDNQNVVATGKAGKKNFPDAKKYRECYAGCIKKTVGAIEDTLPPQENLSEGLNYFSLSFYFCFVTS